MYLKFLLLSLICISLLILRIEAKRSKKLLKGFRSTNKTDITNSCGRSVVVRGTIVKGNNFKRGSFPWLAAMVTNQGNFLCGGTLISNRKVVSAAHCIQDKDETEARLPRDLRILLGVHNLNDLYETERISVAIKRIHIHPDWNPMAPSYDADISIFILDREIAFNNFIQPICLIHPNSEEAKISEGIAVGHGKSENSEKFHENIPKLMFSPIIHHRNCSAKFDKLTEFLSHRAFCGGYANGSGTCVGDSGSGLYVKNNGIYYLRGIISSSLLNSDHECDTNVHSIFMDVLQFYSWITIGDSTAESLHNLIIDQTKNLSEDQINALIRSLELQRKELVQPKIKPLEQRYTVIQGTDFEITCDTTGTPNVTWSMSGGHLGSNARQTGNVLRILNINVENSGVYVCLATNNAGSDQVATVIDVELPREPAIPNEVRLNLRTYPTAQTIKERIIREGREIVFQCRDEGPIHARVQWIRKNNRPLPPGSRDLYGRLEIPMIKVEHSGEYVCEAVGYPKNTPGSTVSIMLEVERFNRSVITPPACGASQATCMNGDCIARNKICDGVFDCTDGSDENGCRSGRCEPNEFQCSNRKCVLKTWRCDGENDCGDNSDEDNCFQQSTSSGPCRYDEYQCANRQCIPKSFQCDSQSDCGDNSDEIGCMAPQVITPPPPMVRLQAGQVFNITCRATGNPVPLIVWRLNWGHIPEKCRTTSVDGFGTLTCDDIQPIDSGAYSCEIINSMGTHFVSPDTILVVSGTNVCPVGYFNGQAVRETDCINCFCFGVSTQCKSADLYTYALNPPITSQTVVGVDGPWNGLTDITISEYNRHQLTSTRHGVQFRASDIPAASNRVYPYHSLPSEYHGNQLKSYGGFLRYEVEFSGRQQSNDIPDVIVQGNGYTLTYSVAGRLSPNSRNNMTVQFSPRNWYKIDGSYATREEIMMVLANVENILIKLQYIDSGERNVELLHVSLDSAALRDFGLGSASLVEECRCPTGYTGLSCESCEVGYIRQASGPWLGRCVPDVEPCKPGTYGDPSRGIQCKPCPCPVPGNSHARTCSLERSGDVVCHCERGYIGQRCEQCAPGYVGNPMSPSGCQPAPPPPSYCDPTGTERVLSNRRCECKPNVVGPRCDQCSEQTFYLHSKSGCINCFCMGVAGRCTSTSYYRDTIRASFATPSVSEFSLVSGYEFPVPVSQQLQVENREIAYREFASNDETYYWSLPPSFLGNIITAYGGNLSYTVRYVSQPSGAASRSNSPDVVIVSGNEITLHHYRSDTIPPFGTQTFTVPIYERSWQHYEEGIPATRQHLLMTLANVTAVYIKATYTTVAEEAALSHVALDVAREQDYGSHQRAWEVEQCSCPPGHEGLSCEDCSPGYYTGEQGLYLGLCEPCDCNGHSEECDSKTGICRNCRDNTYGENCESCLPGFEGNATSGGCVQREDLQKCQDCSVEGTTSCDRVSRRCNCKPNVVGQRCDVCLDGTFGLSEHNPYGCRECFCSGTTMSCSEGIFYREQIPIFIFDDTNHFELTDREGNNPLPTDQFDRNIEENEISFAFNDDSHSYYWNLPDRFTGNLIMSYGGKLSITQKTDGSGHYVNDQDVIIRGNGITLTHSRPNIEEETYAVTLIESEFQTTTRSGPRPATRADLLTVLSNVDNILIRASIRSYTSESRISDIILDTAVRQPTASGRVIDVEVCRCPPGYRGSSCEQCDAKYYRDSNDRSAGLLGTCKSCPCENAESCEMGPNRRVVCHCMEGWTGETCRERPGFQPTTTTSRPALAPPSIEVIITSPRIKIVEIGEIVEFNCNAHLLVNNKPLNIRWYKYDGTLSERTRIDQGSLYIQDAQEDDSGVYICQAQVGHEIVRDNVTLTVGAAIPHLTLSTQRSYVKPGGSAEVECKSSAGPDVKVTWQGLNGEALPYNFEQYGNRLIIRNAQNDNSGRYNCICFTNEGQAYLSEYELIVEEPPAKHITPRVEHAEVGASVVLRCDSQRSPSTYSWTKQHGSFPPDVDTHSEILKLINVQASDAGTYICNARHNGQLLEIPTTLVVTGAIPFFPQSPRSYMKFPRLDQAYSKFNFEITFRPERPNGLILYNGQKRGAGDFISLSLVDGVPQFRYAFGDQRGILKPEKPLSLGEWHTIKVNRVRTNGWMIVDDQHPVIFPPNQKFQGLNLEEDLFIGGVANFDHIVPSASEVKEGFVGCISRLVLNERDIQINQEVIYAEGTTACEPCADGPCMNNGVCLETQTDHGYTCVCQDGYTGRNCQVLGSQCSLGVCGIGRCSETEVGIECFCPLNRTGNRCEYIEHYDDRILSFRDGSYAAYDKLTGKKNIKFKIRPESDQDGVILYAGESDKAYGDFLAVVLKDKHIEFRIIVGGKVLPVIIRSINPVKVHEWMDISVGRSRAGLGYLQVDNEPQINEPRSAGRAQTLYLNTNLYVGGYDKRIVLNRGVGVTKGFEGCVAGLEIAGKSIDMISDLRDSANVQNCGHQPLLPIEDDEGVL
ncbi:basement membrane-specific heparan sulfate proteoglycan core protein-like isoform X1 [Chironomus tepperi]|uniref:basement membrane-specific heparan sulfate proteoglycan core protein-like isoform X1 n=1 Tax=Chironomus tepperi TaxID=113505 RepID=UPI00391EE77E